MLALLDDTAIKSTHSIFFNSLTSRGYQITYSAANAPELAIKDWDIYLYDKIIVFASNTPGTILRQCAGMSAALAMPLQCPANPKALYSAEFGGSVDATALLDFVDAGHDLLLAVDSDASDELRELAADLGVDFDTKGSAIIDHFNRYDHQQPGVVASKALDSSTIFGSNHKHVSIQSQSFMNTLPASSLTHLSCSRMLHFCRLLSFTEELQRQSHPKAPW